MDIAFYLLDNVASFHAVSSFSIGVEGIGDKEDYGKYVIG